METHPTADSPQQTASKRGRWIGAAVVLAVIVLVLWVTGFGRYLTQRVEYAARAPTFAGSSKKLTRTVIVPTLDSPCPAGKNVIWCSSFQLAWNELRDNVIGAPLQVIGAEEMAGRLNAAKQSGADLDSASYYAAGGRVQQGIRERIRQDMASRFPSHTLPDFNDYHSGIMAYAYLHANVPFKHPFRQMDKALAFTDSQGVKTQVAGFGLWQAYLPRHKNIREQVQILYARRKDPRWADEEMAEYALDLCRYSGPYQVIVAGVELKGSLAETLEHVRAQIADFEKQPEHGADSRFGANDEMRLPEMFWRIDHRFTELIDKMVANSGSSMPIIDALQAIEFRLDRGGAVLESSSTLVVLASPRHFQLNRPFLVYMQKRGAENPFFVMWVDNAELLVRR